MQVRGLSLFSDAVMKTCHQIAPGPKKECPQILDLKSDRLKILAGRQLLIPR